jgi:hypothetical protein
MTMQGVNREERPRRSATHHELRVLCGEGTLEQLLAFGIANLRRGFLLFTDDAGDGD